MYLRYIQCKRLELEQIVEGDLMLTAEFLGKIGIEEEDSLKIIELNKKYYKRIEPLMKEYLSGKKAGERGAY